MNKKRSLKMNHLKKIENIIVAAVCLFCMLVMTTGCGDSTEADVCDPDSARNITVNYEGDTQEIFLGNLSGEVDDDLCLVSLADIVAAADELEIDVEETVFDFEASDGFRPTQMGPDSGCDVVEGSALSQGWIDRNTGALVWDDSLGFFGCYYVKQTVIIHVIDR